MSKLLFKTGDKVILNTLKYTTEEIALENGLDNFIILDMIKSPTRTIRRLKNEDWFDYEVFYTRRDGSSQSWCFHEEYLLPENLKSKIIRR